jgi:ubiquinone/menaquinone biosynthesis C-methylase UbiE
MTSDYAKRLRSEIERYEKIENVHDLPAIFHVWSRKYVAPKIDEVLGMSILGLEDFYAKYISRYAKENPSEDVTIASIGAGNGDFEVRIAKVLKDSGVERFRFQCLDVNPAMLSRGREAAAKDQLTGHFDFLESDVSQWLPVQPVSIVMAHHSLHHVQELEATFGNIKKVIGEKGYFLTCDMIGRNGHMRWPEALEIIQEIWKTMPDRYKYNHQMKRFEETYENWDCSSEGFEGIRSQDILPLLTATFNFEAFVAFGNIPDIFVDRGFGHNFSPANIEDVAFIDRIGKLNDRLISDGKIKPTQMIAVMRAGAAGPCKHYLHWTPEFCVRPPSQLSPFDLLPTAPIPITGCGKQEGSARGLWKDGWIGRLFNVSLRLERDLGSISVEAYLPEKVECEPELRVALNDAQALRQKATSGLFSLRMAAQGRAGELLQLRITSDKCYCPASSGDSNDERELAIVLRGIRLDPAK